MALPTPASKGLPTMPENTRTGDPTFEAVISAWDEPLRCQSVYGCRRPATWVLVYHEPCGQRALCMAHYRRWVQTVLMLLAERDEMRCPDCEQYGFASVEQFAHLRPL